VIQAWIDRGYGSAENPPNVPILFDADERMQSIVDDHPSIFYIKDNESETERFPVHFSPFVGAMTVRSHDEIIEQEANRIGIDPDIVRAVMYYESGAGHYFGASWAAEMMGAADTILPMTINPEMWSRFGIDRESTSDLRLNIRAGTLLLKRICDRLENPTIGKLWTIYNSLRQEQVRPDDSDGPPEVTASDVPSPSRSRRLRTGKPIQSGVMSTVSPASLIRRSPLPQRSDPRLSVITTTGGSPGNRRFPVNASTI
jgi:hypothetical protein